MYKVIIVDDEESIKRSLRTIIAQEAPEFQVVACADDGQEALGLMGRTPPDLVITDIRMPVMDGLKLVQEIRARGIQTEIVMISGYSEFSYARHAIQFGVSDYLLKPIDIEEVTKVLTRIAGKLSDEHIGVVERSEWIAMCKVEAEKIAKHLWVLNETALSEELEQIRGHLARYRFGANRLKEMCLHLLSLLQGEMAGLSSGRIQLASFPDIDWSGGPDLPVEHFSRLLQSAMAEIRKIRNWGSHKNMVEAIKQIENNFSNESFSLKNAADLAGMSPTYFSKSFKEELGMSFTQYMAKLRMDKAIELLSEPENKVYEVAYAVGYGDYAHFAKVFKKYYGFSPTDYRNQLDAASASP